MSQKIEKSLEQFELKTLTLEEITNQAVEHELKSDEYLKYLKPKNNAYIKEQKLLKKRKIEKITTCPILDIVQSQHEQLYSRLFIS